MSDAVAPSPSIWTMGSPGTRWMRRKTTETTTQRTGRVRRTRRSGCHRWWLFAGFVAASGELPGFFPFDSSCSLRVKMTSSWRVIGSLGGFPALFLVGREVDGRVDGLYVYAGDAMAGHLGD